MSPDFYYLEHASGKRVRGLKTLEEARTFAKNTKFSGFIVSVQNPDVCEAWYCGSLMSLPI